MILRTPDVAVALDDLAELLADDLALADRVGQDRVELGDLALALGQLVHDALALEGGEPAQLHVEDRDGLDLVDVEQLHELAAGGLGAVGVADQGDDVVQPVQRLGQRAQDVGALLGLAELEAGTPDDDLDLVRDVVADELVQPQRLRHAVDDRQHVRAEGRLQLGVLVEVVQHDLGDRVALEHDDQALAGALAALVADIGDAAHLPVADQVGDALRQVVRVDLVRQLGDHQDRAALGVLVHLDDGAHADRAAAGAVGVLDAVLADDERAGREVRSLDALEQRVQQRLVRGVGVLQEPLDAGGDLAQVVRRDVGRHADRDAGRAVDQQVRDAARQDRRLLRAAVVVRGEVDRLLVDLAQHLHGQRSQPALGVAHGGCGVVARRAEVPVAVDQRVAQRPGLGEAHEGVVDRRVTVRVVVAHDVADDAGALEVAAVRAVAAVVHGVEHAAVHRFEAVPHVRQRSTDDDRHRVVEVRPLHLDLDADRFDTIARRRRGEDVDHEGPFWSVLFHVERDRRCSTWNSTGTRCRGSGRPWRCAG